MDKYEEKYGDISTILSNRLSFIGKGHPEYIDKEWNKLSMTFYIEPKATPRPRLARFGGFYVKGAAENKTFFKKYAKENNLPYINTECQIYIRCYLPTPKSMSKINKANAEVGNIRPLSKPDFDNLAKTYCDMMTGVLLSDDSIITKGTLEKFYSIKPRVEIDLLYATGYDSLYNEHKFKNK